jgi:ABC-type sugar transport system permease subunit
MRQRRNLFCYLMAAPAVLLATALGIYPMLDTVRISFLQYDLLRVRREGTSFVGLRNYQTIFTDATALQATANTILFVVIVVPVVVAIALLVANALNQGFRGAETFRAMVMLPWFVPFVVASAIWMWMLQPERSPINHVLLGLGIIDAPIRFLTDSSTFLGISIPMLSISAVRVWNGLPFIVLIMLAGLQSISRDIYEAGEIDGAGPIQRFFYLTLPMIRHVIAIVLALLFMLGIGHFEFNYVMTGGGPGNLTNVLAVLAYQQAFVFFRFDIAAALSTVIFVLAGLVAVLYIIDRLRSED